MRKTIAWILALACVWALAGCESAEPAATIPESTPAQTQQTQPSTETPAEEPQVAEESELPQPTATEEKAAVKIMPLPTTLDITNLEDCSVAISLEKGDFYQDQTGAVMMDVTVFTYDLYDMADIAMMEAGDTILRGQEEVLISSLDRKDDGLVLINGGLEKGGFELYTERHTVYYEQSSNGQKAYYQLGKVSLPVSADFQYYDASASNQEVVSFSAEDFLNDAEAIAYPFDANHTTIHIAGGYVAAMTKA